MMLGPLLIIFFVCTTTIQACNPETQPSTSISSSKNGSPSIEQPTDCNGNLNCNEIDDDESDEGIKPTLTHTHQHIIVSGLPFQRGLSHGRQAREKILLQLEHYRKSPLMPSWTDCLNFVRTNYIQAIDYYYPNGIVEMKGIADGAGVTLEEILIINAKHELVRWKRSMMPTDSGVQGQLSNKIPECAAQKLLLNNASVTVFTDQSRKEGTATAVGIDEGTGTVALSSATKYAHVLLGQNSETDEINNETAILLEVHPHPCEKIKRFVTLTQAGHLGRNGMNSDGIGIVEISLQSSADTYLKTNRRGWIPSSLLTRMFLEAPTFSLGLQRILHTPKHVSVNIIIATAEDEALNLEFTPKEYFVIQVPMDKEFLVHSNHFKSDAFSARDDIKDSYRGSWSFSRDRRVERSLHKAWPRINESTFQTAFKDRVSYSDSVCEVSQRKNSTETLPTKTMSASIIFNLSQRTLQLSKGPSCKGIYKNYRFQFSQL